MARHGTDHSVPPQAINYRANVWGLKMAGAEVIMATAVSGGINPSMGPGDIVLIDDYLNFSSGRDETFFDGSDGVVRHTDMTHPYSPELRALLRQAAADEGISVHDGGTYCTTNGPRFETPAEIKMMGIVGGDLVGMTGYPEVALAVEAELPYAAIGIIANPAAGLGADKLSHEDVMSVIEDAADPLYRLIGATIERYAAAGG